MAGCGNEYRPVVSAINLVGPAAQHAKYAIALSSPGPTSNGLLTMVDFSGDSVMALPTVGLDPYYLALDPTGEYAYTLNSDGTVSTWGITTNLVPGSVLQTTLLPGSKPASIYPTTSTSYIADPGTNGIDQLFGTPAALKQELPVGAGYTPVYIVGQSTSPRVYAISQSNSGGPGQVSAIETADSTVSATLPVGRGPVYGVMEVGDRRAFILNKTDGTVSVINAQTNALDQFPDPRNTFPVTGFSIANDVVTVAAANTFQPGASVTIAGLSVGTYLNGQTLKVLPAGLSSTQFEASFAGVDVAFTPDSGTVAELTGTIPVGTAPVWADLASGLNQLVVTNQGTGMSPGSLSIIDIPLCSATVLPTNPNCDPNNPIDAASFGRVVATVQVGVNPVMVSVLGDYSRAYVANAGDPNLPCGSGLAGSGTTLCSISVVNLTSDRVTATIPIDGHPTWIASTDAAPTGKVYVVCKDSQVMTVIETDTDTVDTTIPLRGYGISVRVTSP